MQNGTIFCKQYLESMDSKPDFRMIEQANSVCERNDYKTKQKSKYDFWNIKSLDKKHL